MTPPTPSPPSKVGMPDADTVVMELAPLLTAIGAEVPSDLKVLLEEDDPNGWNAEMVNLIAKGVCARDVCVCARVTCVCARA